MVGSTISHYKILEKLGEGGMGVVYKAHDEKLDRIVALKFLPHHLTVNEAEKARFFQEAKAAAALNHPNACSIYRIDEHEGQQFIEMEYVDGVTLRHRIVSSSLKISEAIPYAIQIGEALHEAHSKGIVHRDVKAENIMINSRNQIKVMDFGLAKLKGSLKLTKTSSTVGTLAYMAPEQIQGSEVDARSDIFSFGVVLFEMLTGHMPFRGEHDAAMMYSILNEEPEPIQKYIADPPPEIIHVINKALDKDPADRYQSVAEMVVDLRRVKKDTTRVSRAISQIPVPGTIQYSGERPVSTTPESSPRQKQILIGVVAGLVLFVGALLFLTQPWNGSGLRQGPKTLAVLPFENLGNPEKEYFADGITDEITSRLSRISGLGVIARSSAREYKKSTKTVKQIGEELGVDYVLMGTVRWSAGGEERVRVNPELINVSTTLQTWSQAFEATFSDAFEIQANVASEVAQALDVELLQREEENLEKKLTENARAYDYYLKGLEYDTRGMNKELVELGIRMYEQAIEEDPGFAAAFAKLSIDHATMHWMHYDRSETRIEKARESADRALELDPRLSDAYAAKGWFYYHGRLDYENALKQFDLALQYQPNNSDVFFGIASVRRRQGKMPEAIESYKKAIVANPRAPEMLRQLGETLLLARRYSEAETFFDRTLLLSPDNLFAHANKAVNILLWTGDIERAGMVLTEAVSKYQIRSQPLLLARLRVELYRGDKKATYIALEDFRSSGDVDNQFFYVPLTLVQAKIEFLIGDHRIAERLYEDARIHLESRVATAPDDERFHSALGIAYAGLGRKDEAIREARKGVELLPVEKEAWRGSHRLTDLAAVYAMVGEHDKALDVLERLIVIPSELSAQLVGIDPTWKPLRESARFRAMVRGNEPR